MRVNNRCEPKEHAKHDVVGGDLPAADAVQQTVAYYTSQPLNLVVVPLALGQKNPRGRDAVGWNRLENCIFAGQQFPPGKNVGLAHSYSGTASLDIDQYDKAKVMLAEYGVELDALFAMPNRAEIVSGVDGHGKLIFRMPAETPVMYTKQIVDGDGKMVLEFRCQSKTGNTTQDVLPPSIHPDTGEPYCWGGDGDLPTEIPIIPPDLIAAWESFQRTGSKKVRAPGVPAEASQPKLVMLPEEIVDALRYINPDLSRSDWVDVGMSIKEGIEDDAAGLALFDRWSSGSMYQGESDYVAAKYRETHDNEIEVSWRSFSKGMLGGITTDTLRYHARAGGWEDQTYTRVHPDSPELALAMVAIRNKPENVSQVKAMPVQVDALATVPAPPEMPSQPVQAKVQLVQERMPPSNAHQFIDTDMANSRRFADLFGDQVFHTKECGWLAWDGKRWMQDAEALVQELAKATARSIISEMVNLQGDERARAFNWAKRSESKASLSSMLSLAKSEPEIHSQIECFDTQPMLLNCNNGVIDLNTGILRSHDPLLLLTKLTPIDYAPNAECPNWLKFLDKIMDKDKRMIAFLQRACGYTLTGDTGDQCMFFCRGGGANGKSVFLEILLKVLGEYGISSRSETIMEKTYGGGGIPNDIARLAGRRFVGIPEVEIGQTLAESKIKEMTGGDTITARFLNKEFFDFKPGFKLWVRGNHKPNIRGTDDGIWRRINMIPFLVQIPPTERDGGLTDRLIREELPGILRWMVEGTRLWLKGGLQTPDKVRVATAEYRDEMDSLQEFFAEQCIEAPEQKVTAKDLYAEYSSWCRINSEVCMSKTLFGTTLTERGGIDKKKDGRGLIQYSGIGLKFPDNESLPD